MEIVTLAEGAINELHVGLKGTMNALFLKDLATKTHRGAPEAGTARSRPLHGPSCHLHGGRSPADAHRERFLSKASMAPFSLQSELNHKPLKPLNPF